MSGSIHSHLLVRNVDRRPSSLAAQIVVSRPEPLTDETSIGTLLIWGHQASLPKTARRLVGPAQSLDGWSADKWRGESLGEVIWQRIRTC